MGIVHAKMERKYSFAEDEAGLFDFAEPEVEVDPVPRATIALSGINVSAFIARVDRINVDGLHRTKDDVIKGTVDDLFKAKDFEDVIVRAHKFSILLTSANLSRLRGAQVTFQVRELSRVSADVSTAVSEDEGSVELGVKLPNVFGRGERAAAGYSVGHRRSSDMHLGFTKPLLQRPYHPVSVPTVSALLRCHGMSPMAQSLDNSHKFTLDYWRLNKRASDRVVASGWCRVSGSLYQRDTEQPSSGYRLLNRGLLLDLAFQTSPTTKHHVQWEGLMREMFVTNKTSFKIREGSGELFNMIYYMSYIIVICPPTHSQLT
ncbi:hypothetical protein HF086_015185 [Spodoptera exigua]|uniref:Uncharacterized protein n=1 Tax=Spodoptera exigua TaxID=7107 RepID=A0A922N293_SPOEX|nr:hypothetical protein HF086_015185 [Spodoptera exigua]